MAASYPGAVKTFASRSNGQTIDPSHVNDLQDEVNAIEAGLLNGTAPLNSSNSTVNALVVSSGASANNLHVSSNSTFAVRPLMPPPECALVRLNSTLAVVSTAAVTFLRQDYISNSSIHSTASNQDRFVPQSTGLYKLTVNVVFNPNSSGDRRIIIQDSSNEFLGDAIGAATPAGGVALTAIGVKRFDVTGGHMRASVSQSAASTMSLSTAGTYAFFEKL